MEAATVEWTAVNKRTGETVQVYFFSFNRISVLTCQASCRTEQHPAFFHDVYTFVADMVEKLIESDVAKDDKYAKMLSGKILRKVVKQMVRSFKCINPCI